MTGEISVWTGAAGEDTVTGVFLMRGPAGQSREGQRTGRGGRIDIQVQKCRYKGWGRRGNS